MAFVGQHVGRMMELVDPERAAPSDDLGGSLLDQGQVGPGDLAVDRPLGLVDDDHLGPKAVIWRTRSTEFPREITATNGWPRARQTIARPVPVLPAGQLDDRLARLQLARGAGLADDLERDPVLLAPAGAEVLELDQQPPAQAARLDAPAQLDQRRIADGVENGTARGG